MRTRYYCTCMSVYEAAASVKRGVFFGKTDYYVRSHVLAACRGIRSGRPDYAYENSAVCSVMVSYSNKLLYGKACRNRAIRPCVLRDMFLVLNTAFIDNNIYATKRPIG